MELAPYLDSLRRDLTSAAAPGGPEVARAAELLGGSLEASARMCLLEALSDAAAEITTKLDHSSVEVRLRGREAQFVVTEGSAVAPAAGVPVSATPAASPPPAEEAGDIARLTLRLPEYLKESIERAAAGESISVNAWLVRAISQMLSGPVGPPPPFPPGPPAPPGRLGRRVTGFAQA